MVGGADVVPYATKQDLVLARMRAAILDEEVAPGSRLTLRDWAARLGTSVMPVREALRALATENLVEIAPHRGARVVELSFEELEELYMTRLGLEGLLARLGADAATEETVQAMCEFHAGMIAAAEAHDEAAVRDADERFHLTHYRAAGRPALVGKVELLRRYAARYIRRARRTPENRERTTQYHEELLDACRRQDGRRAEQLVREDIDRAVGLVKADLGRLGAAGR